ncbi:MAG: hypothetical protein AAGI89_10600 [Pseudomonadota bacterium]
MTRDVFLSLLALDSYNRGYHGGFSAFSEFGPIGEATIRGFQPREQDGWQDESFYAIAYNWNGETIISYRGADSNDGVRGPLAA